VPGPDGCGTRGKIALYDGKYSPSAVIDVDDEVNNESRVTENLDRNE
jgi:hypothetical protein